MSERKLKNDSEANRQLMNSMKRTRKLYQFFAVIIATAFISSAITLTISADGPTGFGTVLEPGSLVGDDDYIVFADGGDTYLQNGQTGAIDASSSNAYTILSTAITVLPNGGSIYIVKGDYTLPTNLTIDTPGIILKGDGCGSGGFEPTPVQGTQITGNISIQSYGIQLHDMILNGHLTLTTTPDLSMSAQFTDIENLVIEDGVSVIGLPATTASEVPFSMSFENCVFKASSGRTALNLTSNGAATQHVFIKDSVLDKTTNTGRVLDVSGSFFEVCFQNTLLMSYATGTIFCNFGPPEVPHGVQLKDFRFTGCEWESGGASQTIFNFEAGTTYQIIDVQVMGGRINDVGADTVVLLKESEATLVAEHSIRFIGTNFEMLTIRFDVIARIGAGYMQPVIPHFITCTFRNGVTFVQSGTSHSYGIFTDCQNVNPKGNMTTPVLGDCVGLIGTSHTFVNGSYYFVTDFPILLTVYGGTGVSVIIYDKHLGSIVLPSASSVSQIFIPIYYGFRITWTTLPVIIVLGT